MKTITRLLATAALLFGVLGGGDSVKAATKHADLTLLGTDPNATNTTWNGSTNTITWGSQSNNMINSFDFGLTKTGDYYDLSSWNSITITVSNLTNAVGIRLQICATKSDDSGEISPVEVLMGNGTHTKALSDFGINKAKVKWIRILGSSNNGYGETHTIDQDHPASAKIEEVYLSKPDAAITTTTATGFGDEITELSYILSGVNSFVIGNSDGTKALYFDEGNNSKSANVTSISNTAYFTCTLEKVDDSGAAGDNIFRIRIKNLSGTDYSGVSNGQYLNTPNSGWSISFSGISAKEQDNNLSYGQDANNNGLWYVTYDGDHGFSFQNVGKANDGNNWPSWLKVDGLDGAQQYLKLYKSINFTSTTVYPANDEIFALSKATGYNATTGEMTNGTWTFDTPVDLSNWKYIIIAMENGCADADRGVKITDNSGNSIENDQYDGQVAGTGQNLYFSRWHHQNIGAISLDYLKNTKGIDIEHIKSLSIAGTTKPFAVYLSSYDNTKLVNIGRWDLYKDGNLVRTYAKADVGKFGTICLPYKASVAGAEVYSIDGLKGENGISLTKINGLLEAGRPYFYKACDNVGKDNDEGENNKHNVNFFRADFDHYDSDLPITSNGLIGTFSEITLDPNDNFYVLYSNKLYKVDEDATGELAVKVGANKAYIDKSLITNTGSSSSRSAVLFFDDSEATNVNGVMSKTTEGRTEFYNLSGQRVAHPTKGLYIVNGKKVVIK